MIFSPLWLSLFHNMAMLELEESGEEVVEGGKGIRSVTMDSAA